MAFENLQSVLDRQRKYEKQFNKNLPGRISGYREQQKTGAYKSLDRENRGATQNFSRRGLLYSGLRAKDQADRNVALANELAGREKDFALESRQLGRDLGDAASNTGLLLQGSRQEMENAKAAAALEKLGYIQEANALNAQRNAANLSSGAQGVGSLLGLIAGSGSGADQKGQMKKTLGGFSDVSGYQGRIGSGY